MANKNQEIIDALKSSYWKELETVMNYIANSVHLDGVSAQEIKESLEKEVTDEIGHAQRLAARIKELGGDIDGSEHFKPEQKSLQPPQDTTNVKAVVEGVVEAEKDAVNGYQHIIKLTDGVDFVTQDLAVELMSDEEKHLNLFEGFLKGINR